MKMNGPAYYKRYPRDLIEGTIGLPFEVKVTYAFLLDLIYVQGGRLPDDPRYIAGLLGCSVRKWKILRGQLLETGKIEVDGDALTNERASQQLAEIAQFSRKQAENARGPRKNKDLKNPPQSDGKAKPGEPTPSAPKRGQRLPDDWVLPKDWGEWALAEGWPERVIREEADKFRDYWHAASGQRARKVDWLATWRNWMRNCKAPRVLDGGSKDGRSGEKSDRQRRIIGAAARGSTNGPDYG